MVETGVLENRFALTGNGGSNPSPSATLFLPNGSGFPILLETAKLGHIWQSF